MLEEFKFPKKVFLNVCGSKSGYRIVNILIFVVNIQERGGNYSFFLKLRHEAPWCQDVLWPGLWGGQQHFIKSSYRPPTDGLRRNY